MKTYHVRTPLALDGKTYRLGDVLPISAFDELSDEEKREHERRCVIVEQGDTETKPESEAVTEPHLLDAPTEGKE